MGTTIIQSGLANTLFGDIRRSLLSLFFLNPERPLYLRQVIRRIGGGQGAVQRELKRLTESGILCTSRTGNQVFFRANPQCPIYDELRNLVLKTSGLADVLREALLPLADRIDVAIVYGSFAKGNDTAASDVDVMVIGDVTFQEISDAVYDAQKTLEREINPTVFPLREFSMKVSEANTFLERILAGNKIFLIGDEHELAGLARKRLAD